MILHVQTEFDLKGVQRGNEEQIVWHAAALFSDDNEWLVRRLCVHLRYVTIEQAPDLGALNPGVQNDPLDLFAASRNDPTLSRYMLLFLPDNVPGVFCNGISFTIRTSWTRDF